MAIFSMTWVLTIFPVTCLFIFLLVSVEEQKFYILIKSNLSSLLIVIALCILKNLYLQIVKIVYVFF